MEQQLSRLSDIAIRIEGPALAGGPAPSADSARSGGLGHGVSAILAELATLLEQLEESQTPTAIDLRSLPMSPQDLTLALAETPRSAGAIPAVLGHASAIAIDAPTVLSA